MSLEQDLEEALKEIGVRHARMIDRSLFFWQWLDKRGGLLFKDKTEAGRSKDALDDLTSAMKAFKNAAHRLTERQRFTINSEIAQPKEYETGEFRNRLAEVFDTIIPGIAEAKEQTKCEIRDYWTKIGRPTAHPARRVAEKLAEIYVLGLGKRPTYGVKNGRPSTPFCRAVKRVYDLLGIESDFLEPCKAATKRLADGRLASLLERRATLEKQWLRRHPMWVKKE